MKLSWEHTDIKEGRMVYVTSTDMTFMIAKQVGTGIDFWVLVNKKGSVSRPIKTNELCLILTDWGAAPIPQGCAPSAPEEPQSKVAE